MIERHTVPAALAVAALAATGCMTLSVNMDYDREANFASYETYGWQESEATLSDDNPFLHQRLRAAIETQLSDKGLQRVDGDPDLLVAYHGEGVERVAIDRVGYYDSWYWGVGASTTRVRTYEEGTLVVDLVDADANRLVWRGIANDVVAGSPDRVTQQIETATRQMFRNYPPGD